MNAEKQDAYRRLSAFIGGPYTGLFTASHGRRARVYLTTHHAKKTSGSPAMAERRFAWPGPPRVATTSAHGSVFEAGGQEDCPTSEPLASGAPTGGGRSRPTVRNDPASSRPSNGGQPS